MSSRRGGYAAGMEASPSSGSNNNTGSNRKQSIINVPNRSQQDGCYDRKMDKTGYHANQQGNMTVTSLKSRLAPTIQTAMSAAVDTLLGEVVLVLNETQQELMNKEQENQRLKVRLEVSERELKTLQECLCSAQKLIDQLQITYSGNQAVVGQSVFAPLTSMSSLAGMGGDRGDHQQQNNNNGGGRGVNGAGGVDLGALGAQVDDNLHGFESRDDYKMCQLSIQPDGSVTNHSMDSYSNTGHMQCTDSNRPDDRQQSQGGGGGGSRFEIKEEQGPVSGQQGQHPTRKDGGAGGMRGGGGGDNRVGGDGEQSSHNAGGDLNYIQGGGGGEDGPSRSFTYPLRHPRPARPRADGSGQKPAASRTSVAGRADSVSPGRAGGGGDDSSAGPSGGSDAAGGVGGEGPTSDRPHHCLECGKTFRLISSLKKHIRIHTGEKPYPCGVCGRRFRESGALKTHLRIHTGEKPYSCSECGNSFRHLDGLRKHRRTHTGEKPYVCAICGKRLSRLQHLKHHQLIHTGERPCCCPFCNRSFKEPAALRKHVRTHREEAGHMGLPGGGGGGGAGGDDTDPDAMDDINSLHPAAPSPQMRGFGDWGAEEDDGSVVDCV